MLSLFLGELEGPAEAPAGEAAAVAVAGTPGLRERDRWLAGRPAWTEASWWDVELREDVRALLWLPAGPGLAGALFALPARSRCSLSHVRDRVLQHPAPGSAQGWPCACQVIVAAAWEACAAWVATGAAHALVRAVGPEPVEVDVGGGRRQVVDPAREQLAVALRCSPAAMVNRVGSARALVAQPALVDLVATGGITPWAGRLVTEHLVDLDAEQASLVVAHVVERVQSRLASGRRPYHSAEVNRLARQARLRVCPQAEAESRVRAFASRRVVVTPQRDGLATLVAELAETDAHRIHRRLTAMAAGLQADAAADSAAGVGLPEPRTRDQLRADILVDLLLRQEGTLPAPGGFPIGALGGTCGIAVAGRGGVPGDGLAEAASAQEPGGPLPTGGGDGGRAELCSACSGRRRSVGPEVNVIVSLATLLGLREDPAEVPGVGPVPAEVARELAADGTWRAWIIEAAGAVAATGSLGYVPSPAVARLVRAREPYCMFPGCRQPASRCDLDHVIPWPRGTTAPENLGPLCRRHHGLKTHVGWELVVGGGGPTVGGSPPGEGLQAAAWRWRTPAGVSIADGADPPLPGLAELPSA
jgi:hypothetical protein